MGTSKESPGEAYLLIASGLHRAAATASTVSRRSAQSTLPALHGVQKDMALKLALSISEMHVAA